MPSVPFTSAQWIGGDYNLAHARNDVLNDVLTANLTNTVARAFGPQGQERPVGPVPGYVVRSFTPLVDHRPAARPVVPVSV